MVDPQNPYGIRRTFNAEEVDAQTRKHMHELPCFWPESWVSSEKNFAFIDDHGNIGLLDYQGPGLYEPHLYFSDRGREAMNRAEAMIDWTFQTTPAKTLIGKTPILCKGAWFIVRWLGFQRLGVIETDFSPCYLSRMTKEMWDNREKGRQE